MINYHTRVHLNLKINETMHDSIILLASVDNLMMIGLFIIIDMIIY